MSSPTPPPQQPYNQYQQPMQPVKKKMGCLQWGLIGVAGFCMLGIVANIAGGGSAPKSDSGQVSSASLSSEPEKVREPEKKEEVIKTTPLELWSAYDSNTVSADEMFKGRLVQVSGTVEGVTEMMGDYQVNIEVPGKMFMNVTAVFEGDQRETVKSINKGQKITVVARVQGEMMGSVSIREARLVK